MSSTMSPESETALKSIDYYARKLYTSVQDQIVADFEYLEMNGAQHADGSRRLDALVRAGEEAYNIVLRCLVVRKNMEAAASISLPRLRATTASKVVEVQEQEPTVIE
jgi:hypothetical protein